MGLFNSLWRVEYWTPEVITRESILTVVKARNMAHAVKKIEKKHHPYTVGIISIERIN